MSHKHKFTYPVLEDNVFSSKCYCGVTLWHPTIDGARDMIKLYNSIPDGKEICNNCNSLGYTSEHNPNSRDEEGEHDCQACPIQVQCEACEGTGFVPDDDAHIHTFPATRWDGSFFTTKCSCGYKVAGNSSDEVLKLIYLT